MGFEPRTSGLEATNLPTEASWKNPFSTTLEIVTASIQDILKKAKLAILGLFFDFFRSFQTIKQ